MTEKEIIDLLKRYTNKQCTKDEISFVESWYNSLDHKHPIPVEEFESIKLQTWHRLNPQPRKTRTFYQYAAMLCGILLLSTATYFIVQNSQKDISDTLKNNSDRWISGNVTHWFQRFNKP